MLAEKIVPLWIGERKESLRDSPLAAVHIAAGSFETARTVRIPLPCPSSTQPRRLTTFVFPSFLVPSSCFKTNSPSPTSPLWNRSSSPSTNPRSRLISISPCTRPSAQPSHGRHDRLHSHPRRLRPPVDRLGRSGRSVRCGYEGQVGARAGALQEGLEGVLIRRGQQRGGSRGGTLFQSSYLLKPPQFRRLSN
jgi:hypothetical protein